MEISGVLTVNTASKATYAAMGYDNAQIIVMKTNVYMVTVMKHIQLGNYDDDGDGIDDDDDKNESNDDDDDR